MTTSPGGPIAPAPTTTKPVPFRPVVAGFGLLDALVESTVVLSYTRFGYQLRKRRYFDAADTAVDLSGKNVVVTGATSGIGLWVARELHRRGAAVTIVGRSVEKLAKAASTFELNKGSPPPTPAQCDLSDLADVKKLAASLPKQIDVLVHNAGLLSPKHAVSKQGHEVGFATHVLAPFLLNHLVEDRLSPRGSGARVVWVTSGGMYLQRLDLKKMEQRDPALFDGVVAYAQQKRAQVLLMERFADRWFKQRVASNAMHPGWVDTPGVERSLPRFRRVVGKWLRDVEGGGDTIVWLACNPKLFGDKPKAFITGELFFDRRSKPTEVWPGTDHTPAMVDALWGLCVRLTGVGSF